MTRLPTPGGDDGTWGDILNDFLDREHNADGTHKTIGVTKGGTGGTSAADARTNLGAVGDSDPRLSDSRHPSGAAGGVLGGTFPNPSLDSDIQGSIESAEQTTNKDAAGGYAGLDSSALLGLTKMPHPVKALAAKTETAEAHGAVGDVVFFKDGAITAGSTTLTSSTITSSAANKKVYINNAGAATAIATTSSGLSTGGSIASIPVNALGGSVLDGPIVISSGSHAQLFTTIETNAGATSLPVYDQTPNFAYPPGSTVRAAGAGLSATITSASNGTATLNTSASSTINDAVGWFGTDDTAAFQAALDALGTTGGTLLLSNKGYLLDSAPRTDRQGNAVLALPTGSIGYNLRIQGVEGEMPGSVMKQTNSALNGTQIYTTRVSDSYSSSFGAPSIMGGATTENKSDQGNTWPVSGTVYIENISMTLPENPSIGAIDLTYIANAVVRRIRLQTAAFMQEYAIYPVIGQPPSHTNNFGFLMPGFTNAGIVVIDTCDVYGFYAAYRISAHATIIQAHAQFCNAALVFQEGAGGHLNRVLKMGIYDCRYGLSGWDPQNGVKSMAAGRAVYIEGTFNYELGVHQWGMINYILDANSAIIGRIRNHNATFLGVDANSNIIGGTKLESIPVSPHVVTQPVTFTTPVSGTSYQNLKARQLTLTLQSLLTPPSYQDVVAANSPLGFYRLNETSGTSAADSSGNGYTGSYAGSPNLGAGGPLAEDQNAVQFGTAADQYVLATTLGNLGSQIGSSTIEFWIKTATSAVEAALGTVHSSTGTQFVLFTNKNNAGANSAGSTQIFFLDQGGAHHRHAHFTTNIYDNKWHLVQLQLATTGTHLCWVDGQSVTVTMEASPGTFGTAANFGNPMTLAAWNASPTLGILGHLGGSLSRVAFYLSRLSAADMLLRYAGASVVVQVSSNGSTWTTLANLSAPPNSGVSQRAVTFQVPIGWYFRVTNINSTNQTLLGT